MMKRELFIKLPVKDACFIRAVLQEADLEKEHDLAIRRLERLLPELLATEAASPGRGARGFRSKNRRSPDRIV